MKWRDPEHGAWLVEPDGRREVHFAFEPLQRHVTGNLPLAQRPVRRQPAFKLGKALSHLPGCLLHGRVVISRGRFGKRLQAGREQCGPRLHSFMRQLLDLLTLFRRLIRHIHE